MIRKLAVAAVVFALGSIAALAADFNGKWSGEITTPVGVVKYAYEFHVDGTTLTGKATNDQGTTELKEGKIDGDNIAFVEMVNYNGDELRVEYTGTIDGDQIKFVRKIDDFYSDDFVAKRMP